MRPQRCGPRSPARREREIRESISTVETVERLRTEHREIQEQIRVTEAGKLADSIGDNRQLKCESLQRRKSMKSRSPNILADMGQRDAPVCRLHCCVVVQA